MISTLSLRTASFLLLLAAGLAGATAKAAAGCARSSIQEAPRPGPASSSVAVTVDAEGFHPPRVVLAKGKPATLTFTRTTDQTCATEVVFPELGLRRALPLNQPVPVEVPTEQARTLSFLCGMGMFKSAVVIE